MRRLWFATLLCVSLLCVSLLCVSLLCVSLLCVSLLCVSLLCACASLLVPAAPAAGAETALNAKTSWIGNTFGFGDGTWTQINITALAVTPDGKVYTDAPWDECGAEASVYQNGRSLGYADSTHGWGNGGGNAVAVNRKYLFLAVTVGNEKGHLVSPGVWPEKGRQWYGISRRDIAEPKRSVPFQPSTSATDQRARLAASFQMVNEVPTGTTAEIGGLAADDTTLYASNTTRDRVELYDADSMIQKTTWEVHEPGRIALAPDARRHRRVHAERAEGRLLSDSVADGC